MWTYAIFVLTCLTIGAIGNDDGLSPRVIVIGAGASGIAAASRLLENGIENVVILEAENRIGGRVNTVEFGGYAIDLGAQWVHGEVNNVVYEMVNPLGLIENLNETKPYPVPFRSNGKMVDSTIFRKTAEFYQGLEEKVENITNPHQYSSIGDYFRTELNKFFAENPDINESYQEGFLRLFNALQMTYDAADTWDQVSVDYYTEYERCEGNYAMNWKDRGYSTVLDVLMKKIPDPTKELPVMNKTVLNAEVTNIDYTNKDGTIKVKTNDGKEYLADHVIITPSIGVLKAEYKNWFNPPLPETKATVIDSLELGTVTKIFLLYDEPWWPGDDFPGFCLFWTQDDYARLQNDTERKWMLSTFGFFPVEHKPRLLEAWVIGVGARDLENIPNDKILIQTMSMIHDFFHHYNLTEIKDIIVSRWYTNKHFRGTYSYRSIETEKMGGNAEKLAAPIMHGGKPALQFAGEATSTHHFSTVHGAIETGWREADRIIKIYKGNSKENESK